MQLHPTATTQKQAPPPASTAQIASTPTAEQLISSQLSQLEPLLGSIAPNLLQKVRTLLSLLYSMKEEAPSAMFHVLLETAPPHTASTLPLHMCGELHLLFSPTIQMDAPQHRQLMLRAAGFFGIISSMARAGQQNMQSHNVQSQDQPQQAVPVPTVDPPPHVIPPINELLQSPRLTRRPNLGLFRVEDLPPWFPGKSNRIDAANVIHVKSQTFAKFLGLDNRKISWLYNFFFSQAILTASKKFSLPSRSEKYLPFTPPWYKGDFDAGPDEFHKLEVTVVAAKSRLRNTNGRLRMQLTIAAFYDYEPQFCKVCIDYLLLHLQQLMLAFLTAKSTRSMRHRRAHSSRISGVQNLQAPAAIPPHQPIQLSRQPPAPPVWDGSGGVNTSYCNP